jgi:hypothetical protein
MFVHAMNPILNVSSFSESVEWFEKPGRTISWAWGTPSRFGAVCSVRHPDDHVFRISQRLGEQK